MPLANHPIIDCTPQQHAVAILDILNEAIINSTALYDYQPRLSHSMASWFDTKAAGNFPVIGIESPSGELLGFATYGTFRSFPAYKYTVEHSIYVQHTQRGRGLGTRLLKELIARATQQQFHLMIGAIDTANTASIAMHTTLGFVHAGTIKQAGFKFGHWLDVAFYQLTLTTPATPCDG